MTAAVTMRHGGPDAIEIRSDWPVPDVGADDLLVRVTAAALNNTDIWSREGAYGTAEDRGAVAGWKGVPLEFPRIQGIDVVGAVESVGDRVDRAWIGRRVLIDPAVAYAGDFPVEVMGSEVDGGFAEFVACSQGRVHDVSGSPLSDPQLATLFVTGSSGGVGSAAIQLLVDRGCQVVARTSAAKAARVGEWGAGEISVRGTDRLADTAEVDAVVDVVGGEEFGDLLDRLRDGGRMVTAGAIAGPVVSLDLRRLYLRQRRLIGSTMHTPSDFAQLARIAVAGGVRPEVAEVFPLTDLHRAQERFLEKDFVGKLVVSPG
jgi:NADPH:quinone reductase-like Zn-dependent oxidoreductase